MPSRSQNVRIASRRNHSLMRRCTSGNGTRRRSRRGGKRPPWPTTQAFVLPLLPLLPDQKTVRQHHTHRMSVETRPQAALILVPTQQTLGLLVILFHPVTTVRILHHLRQGHAWTEVAPVVTPFAVPTILAYQPADPPLAVRPHPPATHGHETRAQPALAALPPADGPPLPLGLSGDHDIGPRRRPCTSQRYGEVAADGHHVAFLPLVQTIEEIRVVPIVGVGRDAGVRHAQSAGLVEQGQGDLGLGAEDHVVGNMSLGSAEGVVGP